MDNVTHSIIGLAAGEACARARRRNPAPLWIASLLGNNIPDIDVPLDAWLMRDPLDKLLHHRGYTHTLLLAPLQGLAVYLLVWLFYRRRSDFPRREALALSLLGPFLHILADFWNSYGVHPFWPVRNEWYYGDYVFIIEPWIWVIFLPALFHATRAKALRAFLALTGAAILAVCWLNALVPAVIAAALSAAFAALLAGHRLIPAPGKRIALAWAAMAAFLLAFSFTSRSLAARFAARGFEVALSPYPGNPLCWTAHEAGFVGDEYQARILRLAPWPKLMPAERCPRFFEAGGSAPITGGGLSPDHSTLELGRFTAPRAELERLGRDCRGNAFLRFARIPFWRPRGDSWILGDLRFDRGGGRSFAEVEVPGSGCPEFPVPWTGRFHPERRR